MPSPTSPLSAALTMALMAIVCTPDARADESVWMEGEDASSTTFNQHGWYSSADLRMDVLSPGIPGADDAPGDWLAHFTNEPSEAQATWSFTLREGGGYAVWVRTNPFQATWSWALDGAAAEPFDVAEHQREWINLHASAIDIRFVAWVLLGVHDLEPGEHTLTIRVEPHASLGDGRTHGGVDAIAIANHPWAPSGRLKPGESIPAAGAEAGPTDWFAYVPNDATLDQPTVIDSSDLVEAPAGTHGALTRVGDAFAFADGKPVKLWGVGVGATPPASVERAERQALFLRRYGVNAVRMHAVQGWLGRGVRDPATGTRTFDPDRLDRLDRWFAAFKAQGIYVDWSLFYPHTIGADEGYDAGLLAELPDKSGGRSTSGVVNFMRALQDSQWEWARSLLDHENPHTGMRYADDPALAIVEVHNEDCLFFHAPLNPLADPEQLPLHTAELKRQWMRWVADTYGTDEALAEAWGGAKDPDDAVDNPDMRIYGAWEMEAGGPRFGGAAAAPRMGAFIRFLAETQRAFYERRIQEYRSIGFEGVAVTTAWWAGGPAAAAANTWADAAGDAIDRHHYFGGGAGGHGIKAGEVNNASHLHTLVGGVLNGARDQVADKPFIVTEWTSSPPNQWKAEAVAVFAFVGMGAQGWDGSFHFTNGSPHMEGGWPRLNSYVSETPHYMGQFPALARAVHEGHIAQAADLHPGPFGADQVFSGMDSRPALTDGQLAEGRYSLNLDGAGAAGEGSDVQWSADTSELIVSSERTKAVIGFGGGIGMHIGDLHVAVDNRFKSVLVTSLDGEPIESSGRILITALAQDIELGAQYDADGANLVRIGGPPLLLEPVQATIRLESARSLRMKALTVDGVDDGRIVPLGDDGWRIDGRYRTFYYLLEEAPGGDGGGDAGEGEGEPGGADEAPDPGDDGAGGGEGEAEADGGDDDGAAPGEGGPDDGGSQPAAGRAGDDGCGCAVTQGQLPWMGARR